MHVTFVEYTYAIVNIYTYIQDSWKELYSSLSSNKVWIGLCDVPKWN